MTWRSRKNQEPSADDVGRKPSPREIVSRLAASEAKWLYQQHADQSQTVPVKPTRLAKAIGLQIECRDDIKEVAYLQRIASSSNDPFTLVINPNATPSSGRFAVAHEIGHALLHIRHPSLINEWPIPIQEAFANTFAAELLIPFVIRDEYRAIFRCLDDPLGLLDLSKRLGVNPSVLLTFAMHEPNWIGGLNKIWIRARYCANHRTLLDAKVRITAAYHDCDRFFVPRNQGLETFCGFAGLTCQLCGGSQVCNEESRVSLWIRKSRWIHRRPLARIVAFRLGSVGAIDRDPYFVVATLKDAPP